MLELYNKDCLEIFRSMEDESVDLVVTDCPYKIVSGGCTITPRKDEMKGMLNKRPPVYMALNSHEEVKSGKLFKHNEIEFSEWLPEIARVLKPESHAYIMINGRNLCELQTEATAGGGIAIPAAIGMEEEHRNAKQMVYERL